MRVTSTQEWVALANGKHSLRISGRTEAAVQLDNQYFKTTLYVVDDLATDVFLGADYLRDHDVTVEYGRHCLHIGKSDDQYIGKTDNPARRPTSNSHHHHTNSQERQKRTSNHYTRSLGRCLPLLTLVQQAGRPKNYTWLMKPRSA